MCVWKQKNKNSFFLHFFSNKNEYDDIHLIKNWKWVQSTAMTCLTQVNFVSEKIRFKNKIKIWTKWKTGMSMFFFSNPVFKTGAKQRQKRKWILYPKFRFKKWILIFKNENKIWYIFLEPNKAQVSVKICIWTWPNGKTQGHTIFFFNFLEFYFDARHFFYLF